MSLSFRRPCLEDRQEVKKILEKSGNIDSASAFGTLYLWAEGYDINICMQNGVLFKKSGESYGFPRGAENDAHLKSCLEALKQNCLKSEKFVLDDLLENDVRELDRIKYIQKMKKNLISRNTWQLKKLWKILRFWGFQVEFWKQMGKLLPAQ